MYVCKTASKKRKFNIFTLSSRWLGVDITPLQTLILQAMRKATAKTCQSQCHEDLQSQWGANTAILSETTASVYAPPPNIDLDRMFRPLLEDQQSDGGQSQTSLASSISAGFRLKVPDPPQYADQEGSVYICDEPFV